MSTTSIDRELMELEKRFWDAMKDGDGATAASLTDAKSIAIGPQGMMEVTPKDLKGMIETAPYTLDEYSLDDMKVRALGADAAQVAYTVHEKMTVDGKPVDIEAYDSSIWLRRDGNWVCTLHTETIKGDPFGR